MQLVMLSEGIEKKCGGCQVFVLFLWRLRCTWWEFGKVWDNNKINSNGSNRRKMVCGCIFFESEHPGCGNGCL
jgi:hypothetical protein